MPGWFGSPEAQAAADAERQARRLAMEPPLAVCEVTTQLRSASELLTTDDVAPDASITLTETDYSRCTPVTTLTWQVREPFPWQSADAIGPAMAAMGVRSSRTAIIRTVHGLVKQVLLVPDPAVAADGVITILWAARPLRRIRKSPGPGRWLRDHDSTIVLLDRDDLVVVLEFAGEFQDAPQRPALVRTALERLGG